MTGPAHRIPAWRVVLDGQDLTDRIRPRLLSLTLSEDRAGEADQLDLSMHDHDGRMALPSLGKTLSVAIGWRDEGLVDKGTFIVDEIEHSGAPDVITLRARSADLTQPLRTRRERSWHDTTLGAIIRNLAGEHGLKPSIAPELSSLAVDHLDQTGESDAALLARLGERFDAVATVKAGTLVFMPIGRGTTASGDALPQATITRADGDQHRYASAHRDTYTGVRAHWNDKPNARRQTVVVGSDENPKQLRQTYRSPAEAREHAEAEWGRLQRGAATLSYTLAFGRADLYPEQAVRVRGFKPEIDGTDWLIATCRHSIDASGGFTTALELERNGTGQ